MLNLERLMKVLNIESKLIKKAVYFEEEKELVITFYSGDTWKYSGVEQSDVNAMLAAPSQGSYFVKQIKPKFKAEEV